MKNRQVRATLGHAEDSEVKESGVSMFTVFTSEVFCVCVGGDFMLNASTA